MKKSGKGAKPLFLFVTVNYEGVIFYSDDFPPF